MENRRTFIKTGLLAAGAVSFYCSDPNETIKKLELFLINIEKPRHFSHSTWTTRQHVMIKISTQSAYGWTEMRVSKNNPDIDIKKWGSFLNEIVGLSIDEAMHFLVNKRGDRIWTRRVIEAIDIALWDIKGRIAGKPSIDLLGLTNTESVPGLFCILEKNIDQVEKQAQFAINQGLSSHIKLKIFGNAQNDAKLIKSIRGIVGDDTFIIADPNAGYKKWNSLNELANDLNFLQKSGLNACEDPAVLTVSQWIDLQKKVGGLSLIPDKPLRPAWVSKSTAQKGMGRIYNLHPGTMGNLADMVQLIHKIQSWGAQIMIGDDSLVGAGCTVWQQIAIGSGAMCVEALEKPQESNLFLKCIKSQSTFKNEKGLVDCVKSPGFGLLVDEMKLQKISASYQRM